MESTSSSNYLWYQVDNVSEIPTPSLLVYPERIESNIRKLIETTGNVNSLRPHVKTHKMAEVIKLQLKHGINKFKCATIAEAEMTAIAGGKDILLAMQPVGPNIDRFFRLKQRFTGSEFGCITDNEEIIIQLSDMARQTGMETRVWLDINNGMNRTGIIPGEKALRLYKRIIDSPKLTAEGLHVYDGHIREQDLAQRKAVCDDSFEPVLTMISELKGEGISPVKIVAGGSPTFPVHALRKGVESSPGTILLWDWGYSSTFADMNYLHSAVLLTRIISKPGQDLITLDLGHKSVASEMPQPRVNILGLENYTIVNHNEEHMVIRMKKAANHKIGDAFFCIPNHICPTVDRYDAVTVIINNLATSSWNVEARKKKITI